MKTEFSPVQSVQVITHGEPPHMTAGQKESADGIPIGSEHCLRIFERIRKNSVKWRSKRWTFFKYVDHFFDIFDDIPTYTYLVTF